MTTALSDPILAQLWRQVLDSFDQDSVHQAFLEVARERRRLGEAASAYRQAAKDHEKRKVAEENLAKITALAFAELDAMRAQSQRGKVGPSRLLTFGIALGMLAVAAALARLLTS